MRPTFTAFITKYALTQGIFEKQVEHCTDISDQMVAVLGQTFQECYHGEGRDWHRTKQGALLRADHMREAKIKSLKQQIKKLEKMTFDK